jgi:hypothetical protein
MIRDYMVVSPSLDGVLRHDSVYYEGIKRPVEVMRVMDSPLRKGTNSQSLTEEEIEVLSNYFHDIYGVFMKRLSIFAISATTKADEIVKLQALFQEMIKIKGVMGKDPKNQEIRA